MGVSRECKAQRQSDGSWVCNPCRFKWDNDDEKPPCVPEMLREENLCPHCGSVKSIVTFECVRGIHCTGYKAPRLGLMFGRKGKGKR